MKIRSISKIVPAITGTSTRLIGTVDIDGSGTYHALGEVDPFILLSGGVIRQHGKPLFGPHPHRGHSVVSLLLNGRISSWDSFSNQVTTISAPASYWVDAGSGIFHDELSVIDNESDPQERMAVLQLWVGVREEDRLKPPTAQYDTNLPTEDILDPQGQKVIGMIRYFVSNEKTSIRTPHPITVALMQQQAGTTCHLPIPTSHGGFIVNLNGSDMIDDSGPTETPATFCGVTPTAVYDVAVLDNNNESGDDENANQVVEIKTSSKGPATYLMCTGERMKDVWCKKLVANGAIIAATPEEAREIAVQADGCSKRGLAGGSYAPFGL